MPRRALGRTGVEVSLAGLGCHPLGQGHLTDAKATAIVRRAVELGVTYIDTAPSYGRSEERVGAALEGIRDRVFLATKTLERTKEGAARELERSLERLRTDRIDLWQFHALKSASDLDAILGPGGAIEAVDAKKVRFLGITGHADPHVFVAALKRRRFDTLLIPLNCVDPHRLSFEKIALPAATDGGVGVVAMKVFCSGRLPGKSIVPAEECLRYTYGLPVSTCIVGCDTIGQVELAAHVARNLKPLEAREREGILERTRGRGEELEWYKST
jgi:aryl-alcohol dehydrogenase-like predicted oxidoreductase